MDTALITLYKYNEPTIEYLFSKGIIGLEAKERLEIYTFYSEQLNSGIGRMVAFTITAEKYNKTEEAIKKIIYRLNK